MICPRCDGSGTTSPSDAVDAETCFLCDGSGEAPSVLSCGHPTVVWRGTGCAWCDEVAALRDALGICHAAMERYDFDITGTVPLKHAVFSSEREIARRALGLDRHLRGLSEEAQS